jgi:putative transcription factor
MFVDRFQDHRTFVLRPRAKVPTTGNGTSGRPPHRVDAQTRRLQNLENETECFKVEHTSVSLANRIKTLRAQKELTQRDLALRASVKIDVIRDYENARGVPDVQLIRRLEQILGGSLRAQS